MLGKDQTLEAFENLTDQFERERRRGESVCVEKYHSIFWGDGMVKYVFREIIK